MFKVTYGVVIYKIADMDDCFTFTTVKDFNAEVKVIGAAERLVCIPDYPYVISEFRLLGSLAQPPSPTLIW